jgi:hypothetical protein
MGASQDLSLTVQMFLRILAVLDDNDKRVTENSDSLNPIKEKNNWSKASLHNLTSRMYMRRVLAID